MPQGPLSIEHLGEKDGHSPRMLASPARGAGGDCMSDVERHSRGRDMLVEKRRWGSPPGRNIQGVGVEVGWGSRDRQTDIFHWKNDTLLPFPPLRVSVQQRLSARRVFI
ncbi:hypothetical protein I7I51_04789 [Histoplasma capsulatum]|uniref:Uncharacterized protein n=1 Tax=Ajellomyces capsulatus TaxID=5037 RepID=A0A8A1M5G4_AJECA|nr:hypothetical protein I7I51_04789 [Histoplasma capsulatum]